MFLGNPLDGENMNMIQAHNFGRILLKDLVIICGVKILK